MADIGWFITAAGREQGPFTNVQVKQLIAEGRLQPDMLMRRSDLPRSMPAGEIRGLFPESRITTMYAEPGVSTAPTTAVTAKRPTAQRPGTARRQRPSTKRIRRGRTNTVEPENGGEEAAPRRRRGGKPIGLFIAGGTLTLALIGVVLWLFLASRPPSLENSTWRIDTTPFRQALDQAASAAGEENPMVAMMSGMIEQVLGRITITFLPRQILIIPPEGERTRVDYRIVSQSGRSLVISVTPPPEAPNAPPELQLNLAFDEEGRLLIDVPADLTETAELGIEVRQIVLIRHQP